MNIEQIIRIIERLGGTATIDDICLFYKNAWGLGYVDSSFKIAILNTLTRNKTLVHFNPLLSKWEICDDVVDGKKYLFVSSDVYFDTHAQVMSEIFGVTSIPARKAAYKLINGNKVWFPKFDNVDWSNSYSEDGRYWYEKKKESSRETISIDSATRFVFAYDRFDGKNYKYKFTGVFKNTQILEDGTKVYEIIDDKVEIVGSTNDITDFRRVLVCNIGSMRYYRGINQDDPYIEGGGSYPTKNNDGGEKFNFLVNEDGKVRGFVETMYNGGKANVGKIEYANKISIENIDSAFKKSDIATGVRVIFITKTKDDERNVIVGWYDDATVYRIRQSGQVSSGTNFGYNLECLGVNAHLIPKEKRNFYYPKKNTDGTYNFGERNVSYPYQYCHGEKKILIQRVNDYIDGMLADE